MAKNLMSAFGIVIISVGFVGIVSAVTAKQAHKAEKMSSANIPPYNGSGW